MRLRFLGTGASGGTPGRGRSARLESSLLIQEPVRVLIDVTRDFEHQARNLDRLDAVLLTHAHRDAAGGFAALRRWWDGGERDPLPVYASPEAVSAVKRRFRRLEHCRFVQVRPGRPRRVGGLTATAIDVPHARDRRFRTFAWKVSAGEATVVYASDVAETTSGLRRFVAGASLLVIDGAMWGRRLFSHLTIDEELPQLCEWRVERILLTQIGRTLPPHERAQREVADLCTRAAPAYDGMEVAL